MASDDLQRFVVTCAGLSDEIGGWNDAACVIATSAEDLKDAIFAEVQAAREAEKRAEIASRELAAMSAGATEEERSVATEELLAAHGDPRYKELPGICVLGHHLPHIVGLLRDENGDVAILSLEEWFDADHAKRIHARPNDPNAGIDLKAAWEDLLTTPSP